MLEKIKKELSLFINHNIPKETDNYINSFKCIFYKKLYNIIEKNIDKIEKIDALSLSNIFDYFLINYRLEYIFDEAKTMKIIKEITDSINYKNLRKLQEELELEEKLIFINSESIYSKSKRIYIYSCIVSCIEQELFNLDPDERRINDNLLNFTLYDIYDYYDNNIDKTQLNIEDNEQLIEFIIEYIKEN